jgi:hypothetical protein
VAHHHVAGRGARSQRATGLSRRPRRSPGGVARRRSAAARGDYQNDVTAARALIEDGADVNAKDDSQQSAYLIATSEVGDDPRLLELTLAAGADVDAMSTCPTTTASPLGSTHAGAASPRSSGSCAKRAEGVPAYASGDLRLNERPATWAYEFVLFKAGVSERRRASRGRDVTVDVDDAETPRVIRDALETSLRREQRAAVSIRVAE